MKYDTLVFIGRFQPVHNAHVAIIREAVKLTTDLLIIIGSADQPRTYKNPWSAQERKMMLMNVLDTMDLGTCRVHIECVTDSMYNDNAWATKVQGIVSRYRCLGGSTGIIGHKKDESSFYLDMFPQWTPELVGSFEPLNASEIRDLYFRTRFNENFIARVVPTAVLRMMIGWVVSNEFAQIINERAYIENYKRQFIGMAYPPIFVTVDAVVVCSGHVLMIKRRAEPGKGLWAMPGGFVNAATDKSMQDAMVRELKEETGLKVPAPVIANSKSKVFDAIERSARGRTITHAFLVDLGTQPLPKVKGMDDAEKARWVPISEVDRSVCFEDHYEIITTMLGI
jgi:bifunctional NMN adenylyltransferase/nudix hydrolase